MTQEGFHIISSFMLSEGPISFGNIMIEYFHVVQTLITGGIQRLVCFKHDFLYYRTQERFIHII